VSSTVSYGELHIHHPDGSTETFKIAKPVIQIGRAETNDLVLSGPEVSRSHAQLSVEEDWIATLKDLGSFNGVSVNGRAVRETTQLHPGDVVWIGGHQLIYSAGPEDSARARTKKAGSSILHIASAPARLDQLMKPGLAIPSHESRSVELVHEVSVTLASTTTVADVIDAAVGLLFRIEGVQRAVLMPWEDEAQELEAGQVRVRPGIAVGAAQEPRRLVLSSSVFRRVRWENRPLHIQDVATEGADHAPGAIRAAFCSPLSFHGRQMGVLYADNLSHVDAFSPSDFRLFTTIAAQTSLALATAISRGELLKREVERAAMLRYMPSHVADLITVKEGDVELGGVLQTVTVVFADIRGFSRIAAEIDPRDVVLLLNEFLSDMTKVILDAGGTVDKYIGDCVMALFGVPSPSADDAGRALSAAIQMQRAVARMNASRVKRGEVPVHIGVGLHSGPAVVGHIGSEHRMQYTAVGDAVNIAAGLVSSAGSDQIVISGESVEALGQGKELEHLGQVQLKGRDQKVEIYSVSWRCPDIA
jgi:adenylate cyclase